MIDREKVIAELQEYHDREWTDERMDGLRERNIRKRVTGDALALLKEQQGTIRKKQDDINMLCNEIAKLKHKLHDKWTGTWEWISDDKYRCSECANETYVDECMEEPQYLFCPYCGSKMTFAGR